MTVPLQVNFLNPDKYPPLRTQRYLGLDTPHRGGMALPDAETLDCLARQVGVGPPHLQTMAEVRVDHAERQRWETRARARWVEANLSIDERRYIRHHNRLVDGLLVILGNI